MRERKPYPGFWHAALLCVVVLCVQLGFGVVLAVFDLLAKTHWARNPGVLAGANVLAFAAAIGVGFLVGRPPAAQVFGLGRAGAPVLAAVVIATTGAVILLSDVDNLFRLLLPQPRWMAEMFSELLSSREHPLGAFVLLVVVAPVTEELLFRGLMLRGMLGRYSAPRAIFTTALLFAAVHVNPWQFLSAAALGALFGWLYVRTESLLPCLLGHAIANAIAYSALLLPFEIPGFNAGDPIAGFQPLWLDALGLALLVLGRGAVVRLTRETNPRDLRPTGPPETAY